MLTCMGQPKGFGGAQGKQQWGAQAAGGNSHHGRTASSWGDLEMILKLEMPHRGEKDSQIQEWDVQLF